MFRFFHSLCVYLSFCTAANGRQHRSQTTGIPRHHSGYDRPNIILILTDDLGYGDTSVRPFIGLEQIKTPNLERMASNGMILKNFHTAAATCTPTRASILTGMYPWRMGIKAVFEYGKPFSQSNKNDWLPPLPTIPMALREANYSVFHSGKWHLGGMRNDDLDMRLLPQKKQGEAGGKRCPHPGPNQQGFKNYVSVLDGPGTPRMNALQLKSQLYSKGCTALRHNDADIGHGQYNITGYLSFCEAEHAIHAMNISVAKKKPFFINLWFHAPHSPLEEIPGWHEKLTGEVRNYSDPNLAPLDNTGKYRTMVADMDHQVGRILRNIEILGIEKNTLVVFTSDNGPEPFAGSRAGLNGAKRYLYEGGIRVPAILQWVGTIPAGQTSDMFAVSTDLFPTFLDAAGVRAPTHLHLDGLSLLPRLLPDYYPSSADSHRHRSLSDSPSEKSLMAPPSSAAETAQSHLRPLQHDHSPPVSHEPAPHADVVANTKHAVDVIKDDPALYDAAMRDRVTLWHNDYEGPRRTAAWIYDFKVILDENDRMREMYDMRSDQFESNNLLDASKGFKDDYWTTLNASIHKPGLSAKKRMSPLEKERTQQVTLKMMETDRGNRNVHLHIASHMYKLLQDFARGGNQAHTIYMNAHPGWRYPSTVVSDHRSDFIPPQLSAMVKGSGAAQLHQRLVDSTCGTTPCTCEVKLAQDVSSLPFEESKEYAYLSPGALLNGAKLIYLQK